MRTAIHAAVLVGLSVGLGTPLHAQIDRAPPFPIDTPMRMRAIEAVCTGVNADARNDPRWASYPLKIELVDAAGRFLSGAQVTVTKDDEALASVNCAGPWVLFRLPQGAYRVTAQIEGVSRTTKANVGGSGQAKVILRFAGGAAPKR
jgi:hypothetical protein